MAVLKYTLLVSLTPLILMAQTDSQLMAEGRTAMGYNDCAAARRAFEAVSSAHRDASWLDAVAAAAECAMDLRAALQYYEEESNLMVGSDRLSQKIGELRYKVSLTTNPLAPVIDWIRSTHPVNSAINASNGNPAGTQRDEETLSIQSTCMLSIKHVITITYNNGTGNRYAESVNINFRGLDPDDAKYDFYIGNSSGLRMGRVWLFSDDSKGPTVTRQVEYLQGGLWRPSPAQSVHLSKINVSTEEEAQRGAEVINRAIRGCMIAP